MSETDTVVFAESTAEEPFAKMESIAEHCLQIVKNEGGISEPVIEETISEHVSDESNEWQKGLAVVIHDSLEKFDLTSEDENLYDGKDPKQNAIFKSVYRRVLIYRERLNASSALLIDHFVARYAPHWSRAWKRSIKRHMLSVLRKVNKIPE